MKQVIIFIFLVQPIIASEFWTLQKYFKHNPNQKELMQKFTQVVQDEPKPLKTATDPVQIAILYPGGQVADYWQRSLKSFQKRMDGLQIPYEIEAVFVDENDVQQLEKKMLQLLQSQSDYFVFTLDIAEHKRLIAQLIDRKKPKVILQNITTPLKEWGSKQPFLYVGFDHIQGASMLSEYFAKKYDRANYLMLYYNPGYVSQMRGDSFIKQSKNFTLDGSYYTYADKVSAKDIVLHYPLQDIDFIYSCSTDVTVGATKALQELGLKQDIAINGWGGGAKELDMVQSGVIDVTVMRINDDNGVAMAEAIKYDLLGKEVPQVFVGELVLVTAKTSDEEIEQLRSRAFRYSQ